MAWYNDDMCIHINVDINMRMIKEKYTELF